MHAEQAISIVRGLKSVEVMEPEPALFQAETNMKSGRPPKWTLNGEVLEHSATVDLDRQGNLHSLCLAATDSSMSGPVVFVAGKSRSTAQLTVKGNFPFFILHVIHLKFKSQAHSIHGFDLSSRRIYVVEHWGSLAACV